MDQLNLEKLGVSTVTVITSEFVSVAKAAATAEGIGEMCFVVVPHPMGAIPQAEVKRKADKAFSDILEVAAVWQTSPKLSSIKPVYPAERFNFIGTVDDVNKLFFEKGWSMGLPIIPPTPERIAEMLKGTSRKPSEVLGQVPPVMGSLTIELVAAHAVMAGCKREYMPVLIAVLEALLVPEANWRSALVTTGTVEFMVIVNGPVVKEIDLAYQQGAAGKGHHPNASIGYAVNLIAYTAGGSKPPSPDKGTFGTPGDFVCWMFGENEDKLPRGWEPLHVERGFERSDSVVTVMVHYPIRNIDHWSTTPEEHVRWWSNVITPLHNGGGPCCPLVMEQNPIVVMCPEHAELIASAGWTKDDFRKALWEQARIPLSAWPIDRPLMSKLKDNLGAITEDSLIPLVLKPEQFLIVLGGGAGKHSHYFAPFIGSFAVSKLVNK